MLHKFTKRGFIAAAASVAIATTAAMPAVAAEWKPNKPIEMVIMAGQGGGADRIARLFQSIIQKEGLASMPVLPVNKGGGSGAEALRHLKDNGGDSHKIMATLNSYYTTPLRNDIGVNIEEFTPLARMALDTFVLWVNADSDIKSLDDYVAAVKAAGGSWKMGGTGTGQEDSLVTAMLQKEFGLEITYVPFKGGGTVAKNLVGGHIDSTVNNPSEQMGFYKAGKSRPLVAFTPERLAAFPDVPTARELGHDIVYWMQRSFVGPKDMPAEAAAYYTDMFKKLSETEEWKTYTEEKSLMNDFLSGDALQVYFLEERAKHADILKAKGEGS
ncbi:tripartite tricarboxylate transporter substrate-binding protein [Alisedimentitalea sp. MJ-SS2]|uniref:Bug family tripartite tricarboxylate transporter substrate binding protein n=1 Tax=Aliisedimentitalea sp. MJ-SS2 TaxID=3049795 RepID=UPI00290B19A3|nr:tripartite tricarboxylate transporter substrate-binding protein [Alisedimentitalea sp. MJ-SS2]MDU8928102.1 tripartite tricarboxylate transporter substrate-binding protein [Alisedimentitalea sp. MJ-SS2]